MLTRFGNRRRSWFDWSDLNRSIAMLDALRRDFQSTAGDSFPKALSTGMGHLGADLVDVGEAFELHADVPGLTEKDVTITLDRNVLTLSGERQVTVPEGFVAQRRERQSTKFSRSFTLPQEVDAERSRAVVKDGVLTVQLAKLPEVQPRQISVQSA